METIPPAVDKIAEINTAVSEILRTMPDVVRIRFDIHDDWTGTPGAFFRVLLSDELDRKRFHELARRVRDTLWERVYLSDVGLFPYENFRKESEQAVLKEKSWE